MTNANDQAYPIDAGEGNYAPGLTIREYFAAMALSGLLSEDWLHDEVAEEAVAIADALIEALNKE